MLLSHWEVMAHSIDAMPPLFCSASRLILQKPMERKHKMLSRADTTLPSSQPHSAWYRAYTLAERAAHWLTDQHQETALPRPNEEQARQRLLAWQAQKPFQDSTYFVQRLMLDGLSEEHILALLATEPQMAQDGNAEPPAWMTWLSEAFASLEHASSAPEEEAPQEFAALAAPFIKRGLLQIRSGILELTRRHSHLPFSLQNILLLLISHIPIYIDPILHKTVILELNVARVQGRLQGNSAEERFGNFVRQLRTPAGLEALRSWHACWWKLLSIGPYASWNC
jgi:hypothetical protein